MGSTYYHSYYQKFGPYFNVSIAISILSSENTKQLLRKKARGRNQTDGRKIDWRQYVAFLTFPIGTLDNPEEEGERRVAAVINAFSRVCVCHIEREVTTTPTPRLESRPRAISSSEETFQRATRKALAPSVNGRISNSLL